MKKLLSVPVNLRITTEQEMDAVMREFEAMIDMHSDTLFDEFPFRAHQIRELATESDESIQAELKSMHDAANENANILEALQNLLLQIR